MEVIISEHARFEMARRQVSEELVTDVVGNPQQVLKLGGKRSVCQSRYYDQIEGKEMLLRVVCEQRHNALLVVTAYKTSKIDRYWRKER